MVEVREAARLARRTPETIRRWVWSGRLEANRQGNRLLLRRSDISALAGNGPDPGDEPSEASMSLSEWTARARQRAVGATETTAADLVWGDRAGR